MSNATSKQPQLSNDVAAFVAEVGKGDGPPLYTLAPADARKVLLAAQSGGVPRPEAEIVEVDIPVGPTGSVELRVIRPCGASGALPGIFYFHGGGWILGDKTTHDRLARTLAVRANATLIFVNYSPSPEVQFPVPVEQAYAAVQYVAARAGEFGVDSARLAVAGDSVGGNMAAVVALMTKLRGGVPLAFQLLFYPVTAADFDTESYLNFADGPWLTRRAMQWFWDAYCPDPIERESIFASPLAADLDELTGLPPALVITAQNDVLRDEGEAYAQKLMAAGNEVVSFRCNGIIHDFVLLDALRDAPGTQAAMALAVEYLKRYLG